MSDVFRLFEDKELEHWEDRGGDYGPIVIEKIPNPDGDLSKREPTSIPSPFARIDLVKTAFKYVTDKSYKDKGLDGDTIYHKIVSDCLDVAEIFFRMGGLQNKVQIKSWNRNTDLPKLLKSTILNHQLYGETLNLYLNRDRDSYNFDLIDRVFFIVYDHKIIGGTSPSTLFFTSANDLSFVNIKFGNDSLFDDDYKPLYQRDPEFQKYLHVLFKANPLLAERMKEFAEYLSRSLSSNEHVNHILYDELHSLEELDSDLLMQMLDGKYDPLDTGTENDFVEIIGINLRKKKTVGRANDIESTSDFAIQSTKYSGLKPLVLQNGFARKLSYTDKNVAWDSKTEVPYYVSEADLSKRILPGQLDKYPWLTVSDFLEPYIIRLLYPVNKTKFFDGNLQYETGDVTKGFLLPLTTRYFDFFNTADLRKVMPDGKAWFEMIAYAGSVEVTLRIPIKANGQYVTFKRSYDQKGMTDAVVPDVQNNKGYILDNQFGLTVYPFLKHPEGVKPHYRIMLVDRDIAPTTKHHEYDLEFFQSNNNLVEYLAKTERSNKQADGVASSFFVLEHEFDYAAVRHADATGIVVPLFEQKKEGTKEFTFAIDFGTTNTHIEYTLDYSKKLPKDRVMTLLEITSSDLQYATLHDPKVEEADPGLSGAFLIYRLIPHEFMPSEIKKDSTYRFPQRTAINQHRSLEAATAVHALADMNISFVYEQYKRYSNVDTATNLKWSNYLQDDGDKQRVRLFIEQLMLMIRNKVLLNDGKLSATKLIWFYPASMMTTRRKKLATMWRELFRAYISDTTDPIMMSESVAPFYFLRAKKGFSASDRLAASIDIGGGTSDIVIYESNKPKLLTSFRFAANTLFGDGYNSSTEMNGFVSKYAGLIREKLGENSTKAVEGPLLELLGVAIDIGSRERSEDLIAFFFSLEKNPYIRKNKLPISFSKMLGEDEDLKIVLLLFYAAIIYHLARLMQAHGMAAPRYITFSGTGSKVFFIVDEDVHLSGLQKLTKKIFEKVYKTAISDLELKTVEEPKEITAKGGLVSDHFDSIEALKTVLLGDLENSISTQDSKLSYDEVQQNETRLASVISEVEAFVDLFFGLNKELNFQNEFGVNPALLSASQAILKKDLMEYLKDGLEDKGKELTGNEDKELEETLFFYPFTAALNKLTYAITQMNLQTTM